MSVFVAPKQQQQQQSKRDHIRFSSFISGDVGLARAAIAECRLVPRYLRKTRDKEALDTIPVDLVLFSKSQSRSQLNSQGFFEIEIYFEDRLFTF